MDLFMKQAPQRHLTPRRLHLGVPGLPRTVDGIPGLGRGTAWGRGRGVPGDPEPQGEGSAQGWSRWAPNAGSE